MSMGTSNRSTPSYSRLRKKAGVLKVGARDLDDIIGAFEEVFEEGDIETLDCVWGCLISCYYEFMKAEEGNNFRTLHNGVRRREYDIFDLPIDIGEVDRLQAKVDAYFA